MFASFSAWLRNSPLTLQSAAFFLVYAYGTFAFYRMNNYKVLAVLGATTVLFLSSEFLRRDFLRSPWTEVTLPLLLPVVASAPGWALNGGTVNYLLPQTLGAQLLLIAWAGLLAGRARVLEDLSPILVAFALTTLYGSASVITEHYLGFWVVDAVRRASLFGNPNYFSGFLVVVLPALLAFGMPGAPLGRGVRILMLISFLIGLLAMLFGGSRGGVVVLLLVSAMTAAATWATFSPGRLSAMRILTWFAIAGGSALAVLGIVLWLDLFGLTQRFAALLDPYGWAPRLILWEAALKAILGAPLFGHGPGSSLNLFLTFVSPESRLYFDQRIGRHAHCEPLEVLEEGGLLGLAAWVALWVIIARRLAAVWRADAPGLRRWVIALAGAFVGFHLHGLFGVAPRMMVVQLPLFSWLGVALMLPRLIAPGTRRGTVLPVSIDGLLILGASALLLPWLVQSYEAARLRAGEVTPQEYARLAQDPSTIDDADALLLLGRDLLARGRYDEAVAVSRHLDELIPQYDSNRLVPVEAALARNDLEEAATGLRAYQQRDLYLLAAIEVGIELALLTSDEELFRAQLQLLGRRLATRHRLIRHENHGGFTVLLTDQGPTLMVQREAGGIRLLLKRGILDKSTYGHGEIAIANAETRARYFRQAFREGGLLDEDADGSRQAFVDDFSASIERVSF